MSGSVIDTLKVYATDVSQALRSVLGSLFTSVPYLLGSGELRKEVTEQYPDPVSSKTADDLPARTRGLLFNDIERCTGCRECEKICPAQCIFVETEASPDPLKKWVKQFDIDFAKCVFCGLCAEVCQPTSLTHSRQFEGAVYDLKDLVGHFGRGPVTNEQRAKWAAIKNLADNDEVFL